MYDQCWYCSIESLDCFHIVRHLCQRCCGGWIWVVLLVSPFSWLLNWSYCRVWLYKITLTICIDSITPSQFAEASFITFFLSCSTLNLEAVWPLWLRCQFAGSKYAGYLNSFSLSCTVSNFPSFMVSYLIIRSRIVQVTSCFSPAQIVDLFLNTWFISQMGRGVPVTIQSVAQAADNYMKTAGPSQ